MRMPRIELGEEHVPRGPPMGREHGEPDPQALRDPLFDRQRGEAVGPRRQHRRQGAFEPGVGERILVAKMGTDIGQRDIELARHLRQAGPRPTPRLREPQGGIQDRLGARLTAGLTGVTAARLTRHGLSIINHAREGVRRHRSSASAPC